MNSPSSIYLDLSTSTQNDFTWSHSCWSAHVRAQSEQKLNANNNSHMTVKHWRGLRQVFICRHLNRQWQQQAAVWTDGGTKLWPVVHRRRHYWAISVWGGVMPCHLTPGRSDRLLHLSRSVWRTSCTHTISFSYSCCRGLVSCTVCLCVCVFDRELHFHDIIEP